MKLSGLYAITTPSENLPQQVEAAIAGGARVIQYRDKSSDQSLRLEQAWQLSMICRAARIHFIINDDIELAARVSAAGVHLGRDDVALKNARRDLGDDAIIGLSCYNDFDLALQAQQQGADYIAFGSFFASPTKPLAARADCSLLQRAKQELQIPVVAIGGITPDNGPLLIEAGADMLAVISALFAQADVEQASRSFAQLFSEEKQ
ncbi:MAG TPA: thiamine phosphate synthase [Gammaproteobacteria bacterium]|nr:thiamine phosphate synthase [Gammaproteobacteria bacterium]